MKCYEADNSSCILWLCRIDKDGSLSLDWTEWRNFFQLYPSGDLEDMVTYWRQSLVCTNFLGHYQANYML